MTYMRAIDILRAKHGLKDVVFGVLWGYASKRGNRGNGLSRAAVYLSAFSIL